MGMPVSTLRIAALASALACLGAAPAVAMPMPAPGMPTMQTGAVQLVDSTTVVRRDRLHREDGGVWKKRRHLRDRRHDDRHHDLDGRDGLYKPKATQKFAYDQYGNLRIYDGDGWDRDFDDRDRRDWDNKRHWDDKKKRKRPRIYRMNSLGYQEPSPGLKGVLTTVPD